VEKEMKMKRRLKREKGGDIVSNSFMWLAVVV
jgi:hypothetical protein